MSGELRKPLFLVAIGLIGLLLLAEMGIAVIAPFLGTPGGAAGWGIPMLALLDIQLAFTALLMAAPLVLSQSLTGRIQGIVTFVFYLILILVAIVAGLAALALLMLLIALLTALPFGPIVYAALGYATFPKAGAAATLSFILLCKLAGVWALALAHSRFLHNKGLMLLLGTSLLATLIVSFLQGLVPFPLVSVTDLIAALVVIILALIWALIGLVFGVVAVVKAIT